MYEVVFASVGMPLYEGLIGERKYLPVILDIGTSFTKCGFGEELGPRAIFPSSVELDGKTRVIDDYSDSDELYRIVLKLMHIVYFKYLLVNPKNHAVVVVESLLSADHLRQTLARALYKHFEVPACVLAPSHVLAPLTVAAPCALVLDIGEVGATLVPVCHGVPLIHAANTLPLAARAIRSALLNEIVSRASLADDKADCSVDDSMISEQVLRDIQVRACYAAGFDSATAATESTPTESVPEAAGFDYPLPHGSTLKIPGPVRWRGVECLFTDDIDGNCLPSMILEALTKCPIDLRRPLAENLLVIGGAANIPGVKARLLAELRHRVTQPPFNTRLHVTAFKLHLPPANDNYVAWLGGSLYGNLDVVATKAITREQYLEANFSLPDWSSIAPSTTSQPIRSI